MKIGEKVSFFDENTKQLTGIVSALRPDNLNEDGKVTRSNLIDVKVSRMQGTSQIYENTPLKQDLEEGENSFCYELLKEQKPSGAATVATMTAKPSIAAKAVKSIFNRNKP